MAEDVFKTEAQLTLDTTQAESTFDRFSDSLGSRLKKAIPPGIIPSPANAPGGTPKGLVSAGVVGGLVGGAVAGGIPLLIEVITKAFSGAMSMLQKLVSLLSLILKPIDLLVMAIMMPLFWVLMPLIRILHQILMPFVRAYMDYIKANKSTIQNNPAMYPLVMMGATAAGLIALFSNLVDMISKAIMPAITGLLNIDWSSYIPNVDWTLFTPVLDWLLFVPALAWSAFLALLDWNLFVVGLVWDTFVPSLKWSDFVTGLVDYLKGLFKKPETPKPSGGRSTSSVDVQGNLITQPTIFTGVLGGGTTFQTAMDAFAAQNTGGYGTTWGIPANLNTGMSIGAGYAEGGFVESTGIAKVHKGETITPAGKSGDTFNITINNPTIDNTARVRELARLVLEEAEWKRTVSMKRGF